MSEWTTEDATAYGDGLLRGDRVVLRPVEQEDLETLAEWWRTGGSAVLQGPQFRPAPREGTIETIRALGTNDRRSASVAFAVTDEAGALIGHVTLKDLTLPTRIAVFGIAMAPGSVSRGYGTDATRVAVRYAFLELGAHKVELRTSEFNTRAIAAYRKVGFVEEGRQRAGSFKDGRFFDMVLMGVLAEEWPSAAEGSDRG